MSAAVSIPVKVDGESLLIRPMRDADRAEIQKQWVKSYRNIAKINPAIYDKHHHDVATALLERGNTFIVCSPNVDTTILAWACGEKSSTLHYAHVVHDMREIGLARMAITAALGDYPSRIYVSHRFVGNSRRGFRFSFNPYLLGVIL